MIIESFFSFILMSVLIINGQTPPPSPPAETAPAEDSSFWSNLFPPSSPTPEDAKNVEASPLPAAGEVEKKAEEAASTISDTVSQYTDQALDYTGDLVCNASAAVLESGKEAASTALKEGAGLISEPGSQVDPNKSFIEQAASYINLPPNVEADPNTIFGLYDALSKLVTPTPDGGVTVNMPTSEMLEKIKPWTDGYFDISPLITAFKGYEAYQKAKNTVNDVKNKVQDTASNVKDGVSDAANNVKDFGGEAVGAVKDLFGR